MLSVLRIKLRTLLRFLLLLGSLSCRTLLLLRHLLRLAS